MIAWVDRACRYRFVNRHYAVFFATTPDALVGKLAREVLGETAFAKAQIGAGTILPDGGSGYYHPDALNEADRQAVNAWIRTPGNFDSVIDFDAVTRDPAAAAATQASPRPVRPVLE